MNRREPLPWHLLKSPEEDPHARARSGDSRTPQLSQRRPSTVRVDEKQVAQGLIADLSGSERVAPTQSADALPLSATSSANNSESRVTAKTRSGLSDFTRRAQVSGFNCNSVVLGDDFFKADQCLELCRVENSVSHPYRFEQS